MTRTDGPDSAAGLILDSLRERRPAPWLVAIVGIPGAGKSTVAAAAAARVPGAVVVPMDGYHLPRAVLSAEQLARRGDPNTFDPDALRADLLRLRKDGSGTFPAFDHATKDPHPGAVAITFGAPLVIVEGLYYYSVKSSGEIDASPCLTAVCSHGTGVLDQSFTHRKPLVLKNLWRVTGGVNGVVLPPAPIVAAGEPVRLLGLPRPRRGDRPGPRRRPPPGLRARRDPGRGPPPGRHQRPPQCPERPGRLLPRARRPRRPILRLNSARNTTCTRRISL